MSSLGDTFLRGAMWLGTILFWFLAPFYSIIKWRESRWTKFFFGFIISTLANGALKLAFDIPRVHGFGLWPGFPSFHAQTAFYSATYISMIEPRLALPAFVIAGLVGIARVEFLFHTPFEVVAGMIIGATIALAIYYSKFKSLKFIEVRRQLLHISGAFSVPAMLFLGQQVSAAIVFTLLIAFTYLSFTKHRIRRFTDIFKRESEDHYVGAILYLFSITAVILLFPIPIAAAAVLALTLGDGFATLFGEHLGSTPLFLNKRKSLEGSLIAFLVTFVSVTLILGTSLALMVAMLTLVLEGLDLINDNLGIPFGVAIFLSALAFAGVPVL